MLSGPEARFGHTMVLVGGKVVLFGGFSSSSTLSDTWELDTATMTWTNQNITLDRPLARGYYVATAVGNVMYMYGGWSDRWGSSSSSDLWLYNPAKVLHLNGPF